MQQDFALLLLGLRYALLTLPVPLQVFEELARAREKGLKPDLKCLNAVISACARCANFDKARDVFCEMVAEGGTGVNEITYGALLKVK